MDILIWYLFLGAVAGTAAGLLGIGGGLLIVPAMTEILMARHPDAHWVVHVAVGTSLATIVATAISASWAHHRRGAVLWPVFARMTPGIVAGALAGAWVADHMSSLWLRGVFGVFEILVAIQMLTGAKAHEGRTVPGVAASSVAGGGIGLLSALVGIGGGTLTVPWLVYCHVPIRNAVATASACGLPIALAGTVGFVVAGWGDPGLPGGSTGFVYWPAVAAIAAVTMLFAPLGAKLAHTLPEQLLRRLFAGVLVLLGLRMLFGA